MKWWAGASGYSKRTARSQGQRLLTNVDIAAAIKTKLDERSKRTGITADWVLHELRNLAGANILDYITIGENGLPTIDLTNMTRDQAAALRGLKATQVDAGDGPVAMKVDIRLAATRKRLWSFWGGISACFQPGMNFPGLMVGRLRWQHRIVWTWRGELPSFWRRRRESGRRKRLNVGCPKSLICESFSMSAFDPKQTL